MKFIIKETKNEGQYFPDSWISFGDYIVQRDNYTGKEYQNDGWYFKITFPIPLYKKYICNISFLEKEGYVYPTFILRKRKYWSLRLFTFYTQR